MRQIEVSAPTVEEATELAMQEFGVNREQVDIEIINEGKGGMLGLGREDACIKATLIEDTGNGNTDDQVQLAKDILIELLAHLELSADVVAESGIVADEEEQAQPMVLDINGDELGILIGRRGQTLASLQYILRLMLSQKLNAPVSLVLDVNGYKQRRYESLRTMAHHIAEQVAVSHRAFAMEPMPAYERRIVHLALAHHPQVMTQSVGFGEARKVTVAPKGRQSLR